MKTLYLDCGMGAAGDMLTGALLELLPDPEAFLAEMNALGIPGVKMTRERVSKRGIKGTHITVTVNGEGEGAEPRGHSHAHRHHHSGPRDIERIVEGLALPDRLRGEILAVYAILAEAESQVHGVPVSDIHFHEIGTLDAVADITAVCLLLDRLAPLRVVVSPVHVGSGYVRCAHGVLPVPAPATAYILRDVPIYGGEIDGELCTPTGAALLKHIADSFGNMPAMRTESIGYGMGKKDFERVNCVRALLGETEGRRDRVLELSCNVDDMTGEGLGFAMERLFDSGALEVFTVPVGMKKSRPGTLLRALCREEDRERLLPVFFKYTTTIGVRETACERYVLERGVTTVKTPYGPVRRKDSAGYGVRRSKYEYEDLAAIAKARGLGIDEVIKYLEGPGI